jgi:lipoprotein-releasing system ATP-binding protein
MNNQLELRSINRTFKQGQKTVSVLRSISLDIGVGEIVGLIGPSGSGKSTLLHLAGLLEQPDSGQVRLLGQVCNTLSDKLRTKLRLQELGFIYQHHHLLSEFSAVENVIIPQMIAGKRTAIAVKKAKQTLDELELSERYDHRPGMLSGGEQQRVAIARALINNPSLLLADEPTGNLDPRTSQLVFSALVDMSRKRGLSALIATHNINLCSQMDRVLRLEDGYLLENVC